MAANRTGGGRAADSGKIRRFREERERLNDIVMKYGDLTVKRFFSLDSQAYREGALPSRTKEMLGLVASLVLRCDDCILYHLARCKEEGVRDDELVEALGVGLVVGGSIAIPHLRRALDAWDGMKDEAKARSGPCRDELLRAVRGIVAERGGRDGKLARVCRLLADNVPHYDWVGFYLTDPAAERELVLGPFAGEPTEHVRIPFGRGICGQAAERGETVIVQDVTKEANYLSCSAKVKAEIVAPLIVSGRVVGELDVDSHSPSPFTEDDRRFLEAVCGEVAALFREGPRRCAGSRGRGGRR